MTAEEQEALTLQLAHLLASVDALVGRLDRQRLEAAPVRPNQPFDTWLRESNIKFTKGSSGMTTETVFIPLSAIERRGAALLVEATGEVPARLRGAFGKGVDLVALTQMHSPATEAGRLLSVEIEPGGKLTIKALVTDRPAARKVGRTYPGISVKFDAGEIAEISLVDRPFEKSAQDRVLAKIYGRETEVTSPLQRALKKLGTTVPLLADEREALMAVPGVAERLERLGHVEIGGSDPRKEVASTADALLLIRGALSQPISGDPRFSLR